MTAVATACRTENNTIPEAQEEDRIIATASRTERDDQLLLTWFPAPCETFKEVVVVNEPERVVLTIRVVTDVATCPPDSPSETVVDLGEPLGDRLVWDASFGADGDSVAVDPG